MQKNDDEILVEDTIDLAHGIHRVHVMGIQDFEEVHRSERWMARLPLKGKVLINCSKTKDEAGLYHLILEWRIREACHLVFFDGKDRSSHFGERDVVFWAMEPNQNALQAVLEAAMYYQSILGAWPAYVWIRALPKGLQYGADVDTSNGKTEPGFIFSAYWMPVGFVAVGC
jgi:hypothetical protein